MPSRPWRFEPWVSSGTFRGLRLLLVGESHYDDEPDQLGSEHIIEVVTDYGVGDLPCKTKLFRNAYAAFTGDHSTSREGKSQFWKSVSYCNYFQRPMSKSNEQPDESDFKESEAPFDALLDYIAPQCFVVMSDRLWRGMKNSCVRIGPIGPLVQDDIFEFRVVKRAVPAIHINHPSPAAGVFEPQWWHPVIDEFLTYVAGRTPEAT